MGTTKNTQVPVLEDMILRSNDVIIVPEDWMHWYDLSSSHGTHFGNCGEH